MFKLAVYTQLVAVALAAIGPSTNLQIGNKNISPDGFDRSAVLAGADADTLDFPGPVIHASKGDTFNINVVDALTDASMLRTTSIHWHGFFQSGSAWADGPAGVTQCPIAPGNSFLYEFSAADQAGTFWYHSHHVSQYCDGLRGAMVVYDPEDPHLSLYDVDNEETVITLADWYHTPGPQLDGTVPPPDSTLINGKGRSDGGPTVPLAVIAVRPNKRYRFRLVNIACNPAYTFSIDGHTMTVIEADGISTEALEVDSLQIFAGQRYSIVVETNQAVDNYWIRADPNRGTSGFAGGLNSAILQYEGAPINTDPTSTQSPNSNPLLEQNLHPLTNAAAPGTPTEGAADVNLNLAIAIGANGFTVNGAHFSEPNVPVLLQILSGTTAAQDLLPAGSVYNLPLNSVIEISMPGGSPGSPHPIHLHGHAFSVVRSAGVATPNYVNPVQRDVVSIGAATTDNVTIRFRTDNAGPWIMHCHIDWHLVLGLSVVFAEDAPSVASSDQPTAWDALCPAYDALPAGTR
ncbi:laccase 2 precursor [Ephemerocybe angulata]|uniref:Laccase 2 n=1 Tax=Ephemerocybe angulata TaxID=980116 RepID=A0A8H6LXD3_9AGAR|nr:laccase 2 precursor [Tulosesus angulatus]